MLGQPYETIQPSAYLTLIPLNGEREPALLFWGVENSKLCAGDSKVLLKKFQDLDLEIPSSCSRRFRILLWRFEALALEILRS